MFVHLVTIIYIKQIKTISTFPCATNLKEDFRGDDFKKPLQSDFPHQAVITTKIKYARFFG